MGVTGLWQLLYGACSSSVNTENRLKDYAGKAIAMDGNYFLYRSLYKNTKNQFSANKLDRSSLLTKTFYNCLLLLENGIRPVYVFDGHSPKVKFNALKERNEKRTEAIKEYEQAEKEGNVSVMREVSKNTLKLGKKEVKTCNGLLKLMGIPYIYAPSEGEAQCAALVESGMVYAAATQDSDALVYGTKIVLKNLSLEPDEKRNVDEIHLDKMLEACGLSLPELIDLSILLGCDYCKGIKGLGVNQALEFVHKYGCIENILDRLDRNKFEVPNDWLFEEARSEYRNPKITALEHNIHLTWRKPDEEGIVKYLQEEIGFHEPTIRGKLKKLSSLQDFSP